MKKAIAVLIALIALFNMFAAYSEGPAQTTPEEAGQAASEEAAQTTSEKAAQASEAEWNLLIYLCGSDLESKQEAASKNLEEIMSVTASEDVHILIETGGAKEWHTKEHIGIEVANDRLQRWIYGTDGFVLVEEAEDACMSYSQTLSDFIQWAAERYPARKNMLLLWDHGGGSCTGLIADENYNFTIMPVYALEKALRDGGTHFDLILTDTCLMASLEICQAVAPYADYLAASEEVMAGDGTCYAKWVAYLCRRPECTALQLAKRICDLTQQSYIEKDDQDTIGMFTMSVIDLSLIGPVVTAFNAFIHEVALLTQSPDALFNYAWATHYTENYWNRDMYDLFDLSRRAVEGGISPKTAHAVQDAIEDAVVYNLRSASHIYSHGLSIFNSLNADDKTLDHYARTCKNAEHLAYLDVCNPKWDAPDWVYEQTERLPKLHRSDYLIKPVINISEDGTEAWLTLETGLYAAAFISYELFDVDEDTGVTFTLGRCGELTDSEDEGSGEETFKVEFDGTWPALDGMPQYMEIADDTEDYILYNVPVSVENWTMQMRVKKDYPTADANGSVKQTTYEIQGFWNNMDSHSGLPGRDVYPLSEVDGWEIGLCRVVYSNELKKVSDRLRVRDYTINKDVTITPEKLPAGEYKMRFVIEDIFGNTYYSDTFTVNWDEEKVTYAQD